MIFPYFQSQDLIKLKSTLPKDPPTKDKTILAKWFSRTSFFKIKAFNPEHFASDSIVKAQNF